MGHVFAPIFFRCRAFVKNNASAKYGQNHPLLDVYLLQVCVLLFAAPSSHLNWDRLPAPIKDNAAELQVQVRAAQQTAAPRGRPRGTMDDAAGDA